MIPLEDLPCPFLNYNLAPGNGFTGSQVLEDGNGGMMAAIWLGSVLGTNKAMLEKFLKNAIKRKQNCRSGTRGGQVMSQLSHHFCHMTRVVLEGVLAVGGRRVHQGRALEALDLCQVLEKSGQEARSGRVIRKSTNCFFLSDSAKNPVFPQENETAAKKRASETECWMTCPIKNLKIDFFRMKDAICWMLDEV
uniref:Uncharacterized protein n=1 Tax=Romanomermis culicivorax TaxID=13658 RepID=A0A915IPD5_ROMCU